MQHNSTIIKVALADDHVIIRQGLAKLVDGFENCEVIFQAGNGHEVVAAIKQGMIPDVLVLDQNMPDMDGLETTAWLFKHLPQIHILMLSMYDSELNMIRLLRNGVKGFLKKDIYPSELNNAIESVMKTGFYYSPTSSGTLFNLIRNSAGDDARLEKITLTEREINFLKLCSTDLTYKEIATQMNLNPRSIEQLRDELFDKLEVQSRSGLIMVAIRHGIISF